MTKDIRIAKVERVAHVLGLEPWELMTAAKQYRERTVTVDEADEQLIA